MKTPRRKGRGTFLLCQRTSRLRDFWIPAFHEVIPSERRNDTATCPPHIQRANGRRGSGEFTLRD